MPTPGEPESESAGRCLPWVGEALPAGAQTPCTSRPRVRAQSTSREARQPGQHLWARQAWSGCRAVRVNGEVCLSSPDTAHPPGHS